MDNRIVSQNEEIIQKATKLQKYELEISQLKIKISNMQKEIDTHISIKN